MNLKPGRRLPRGGTHGLAAMLAVGVAAGVAGWASHPAPGRMPGSGTHEARLLDASECAPGPIGRADGPKIQGRPFATSRLHSRRHAGTGRRWDLPTAGAPATGPAAGMQRWHALTALHGNPSFPEERPDATPPVRGPPVGGQGLYPSRTPTSTPI